MNPSGSKLSSSNPVEIVLNSLFQNIYGNEQGQLELTSEQLERGKIFKELHQRGRAFVIPNPWDAGSARALAAQGFEALATTSSGFAFTLGRADGRVSRDEVMAHIRDLVQATDLPLSVDLENCFSDDPREAAETIRMTCEAGAVGGSIEDWSGPDADEIYAIEHAAERVQAAVEVARSLDIPFTLTARAENLIRNRPDLDDTILRLQRFEEAGADVLYAPGLKSHEEVALVCSAVSKPVNILARPGLTVAGIEEAGGVRISLGGALARTAIGGFLNATNDILNNGGFDSFKNAPDFRKSLEP